MAISVDISPPPASRIAADKSNAPIELKIVLMALNLKADSLHLRPIGYKLPYSPLALYARQKPLVLKFDKSATEIAMLE